MPNKNEGLVKPLHQIAGFLCANHPSPTRGRRRDRAPLPLRRALLEAARQIGSNHALEEALEVLENAVYEHWDFDQERSTPFQMGDRVRCKVLNRVGFFICSASFDGGGINQCQVWFDDNPVKSEPWHINDLVAIEEGAQ